MPSINSDSLLLIQQFGGALEWATEFGLGVNFEDTALDDVAMGELSVLWPQVALLNLSETKITDDGLRLLQHALRLEVLEVNGTAVTQIGLQRLRQLPALVEIRAGDTALNSSNVAELQSSGWHINIEVHRRGEHCGWMQELKELLPQRGQA